MLQLSKENTAQFSPHEKSFKVYTNNSVTYNLSSKWDFKFSLTH